VTVNGVLIYRIVSLFILKKTLALVKQIHDWLKIGLIIKKHYLYKLYGVLNIIM
jgi:hypothetical protein